MNGETTKSNIHQIAKVVIFFTKTNDESFKLNEFYNE